MNHPSEQTIKLIRLQQSIRARKGLIGCGKGFSVALHSKGHILYTGTDRWGQSQCQTWTGVATLLCQTDHVAAVLEDGSLRVAGRHPMTADWAAQIAHARRVEDGEDHVAVLLGNGRVSARGHRRHILHVDDFPTVADVCCGRTFTAGLCESGRVMITGGSRVLRHTVRGWHHVAGLFADCTGRVLYAITAEGQLLSSARLPRCAKKWRNLVFVAADARTVWGVTATGQLLSTDRMICQLPADKHYIACAVSHTHVLALTRDGHVYAAGANEFGQGNTARFGAIFGDFEEFIADRRAKETTMEADERTYQVRYTEAMRYCTRLICGDRMTACITADGHVLTSINSTACKSWTHVRALACGTAHMLALFGNGRVAADGNDMEGCCAVDDWRHIKAIAAGKYHSLGLTENGHVYFGGRNDKGQGDVAGWQNIRSLYAADDYTVGVTYSGQICIAGQPPFDPAIVDDAWASPIEVVATATHMACLYADGRVRSTQRGSQEDDENVAYGNTVAWSHVRAIAAGRGFTLGLCYGGSVLSVGDAACRTQAWRQIVAIGCGNHYALGLTVDGRVLSTGLQATGKDDRRLASPDTARWQHVLAVKCGPEHAAALTHEGQVLACGPNDDGQCSTPAHFTLFRDVRQLYGYGHYRKVEDCGSEATDDDAITTAAAGASRR